LASSGAKGIPRLRIPALVVSDGPNGVGHAAANVTAFPNAEVVAAAWDRTVAHRFGAAVGAEAAGKGLNLLFAPTVNILRTSRWGRTAETLGEDPYLAGELVASEIRGMQGAHVIAQVKHFATNNQEIGRFGNPLGNPPASPAVNVLVSERALQEIYFPAFRAAGQDGRARSVLCSYPPLKGLYACQKPATPRPPQRGRGVTGVGGPGPTLAAR